MNNVRISVYLSFRVVMGSVSNYVVNNGACAVTVVKSSEGHEGWPLLSTFRYVFVP